MAYSDVKDVVVTVAGVVYQYETAQLQIDAQFEDIRPHSTKWEEQGFASAKWSLQINQVDAYGTNPDLSIPAGADVTVSFNDVGASKNYTGNGKLGSQGLSSDKSQAANRQTVQILGTGILAATPDT